MTIHDGRIYVVSPYNHRFVSAARNLRGQWKNNEWVFDDSLVEYVREAMIDCFGTTGEHPYREVILKIINFSDSADKKPLELFGRTIVRAFGRDSGVKLGDDIVWISGEKDSGGSVKNWEAYVSNATFEIHKFPEPALQTAEVQEAITAGWCEVRYPTPRKQSREKIVEEINDLEARIVELRKQLESC